jgi:hypothetical protein
MMTTYQRVKKFVSPPHFTDEETNRTARILHVTASAVLIGVYAIIAYRAGHAQDNISIPLVALSSIAVVSIMHLWWGHIKAS